MLSILSSSFCPVVSVEVAVADGFCDVVALYLLRTFEVGNGSCYFEDAVVGAGGEVELLHGCAQQVEGWVVELHILLQEGCGHLGIAMDALERLEPLFLDFAGSQYSLTNFLTWFAWLHLAELGKGHRLNFAVDIDTV